MGRNYKNKMYDTTKEIRRGEKMRQIKEFKSEKKCNEWLAKNENLTIIDIKFQMLNGGYSSYLVIYETSLAYPAVKDK